ncbi:hypothetical protein TW65_04156 [Stemphylium lycopersici]|uniref:Uncharacterized protein n=1 Tax=Stemphylium lycopersici TaxID=183478 RepID=A0A364NF29_STELY|nr:hypothetical protein TW65_04156 [Stemphylium lycopersici]RAR15870.1 hypothetical protein DDE83_000667 [Stemphylium lycopersici]
MAPVTTSPMLSRISIICLFVLFITATQASALFPRHAETCGGNTNLQQCGNDFPSSFCCPKDSTCMNLNSGEVQSVICCPSGSDCSYIQPTTCDITQLNATLHPDNQMHLSETDGIELPKCGDKCCSLGYTCQGNMCAKDTSPTPSPSSTSSATPSSTAPASASQTSDCPAGSPVETGSSFDGKSFAAGFIPGLVIGALSTLALLWIIKKRRESQAKNRYSGDFGHVARQISDPIYDPQHAARTDFMRRGSRSATSSPNSTDRIVQGMKETNNNTAAHGFTPRIKSMWDRTPKLNFGFTGGLPPNPAPPAVRAGNPYTDPYQTPPPKPKRIHSVRRASSRRTSAIPPHIQPQYQQSGRPGVPRSGSSETIDVLMPSGAGGAPGYPGYNHSNDSGFLQPPQPPAMRAAANRYTADSAHTTFTKLMERAGFDEGGRQEVRDYKTPRV